MREAVDVSAAALDGIARSKWPPYYGPVLADRGNALATLARRQSQPELMHQALDAYRTAIETFDKGGYAPQAADTRRNLGNVLLELGAREGSADMIREDAAGR